MDSQWSIRAEGLSKKFGRTLGSSMRYGLRDSLTALLGRRVAGEDLRKSEFWAVKDVSFELKRGESLGIMGVNGSGKSTLLRLLTGVYRPDVGRVSLRGTTGALIAAGAGFAPMLTGRENVYVNGALLGMSRAEVARRMEEIVAFAELEGFLDMPVKNYSSGMAVRLGFAVAAMSEPDVLIVDEVLAVGDLNFQKKCFDYLFRLKQQGTTIVLVSHSVGAVWSVCNRGLFLDKGAAVVIGDVESVIKAYDEENARNSLVSLRKSHASATSGLGQTETQTLSSAYGAQKGGTGIAHIHSIVVDVAHTAIPEVQFRQDFTLILDLEVNERIPNPILRVAIDAMHYRFIAIIDNIEQGFAPEVIEAGRHRISIKIRDQRLRPGAYKINCAVLTRHAGVHLFYWFGAAEFQVLNPKNQFLYADDKAVLHLDAEYAIQ